MTFHLAGTPANNRFSAGTPACRRFVAHKLGKPTPEPEENERKQHQKPNGSEINFGHFFQLCAEYVGNAKRIRNKNPRTKQDLRQSGWSEEKYVVRYGTNGSNRKQDDNDDPC